MIPRRVSRWSSRLDLSSSSSPSPVPSTSASIPALPCNCRPSSSLAFLLPVPATNPASSSSAHRSTTSWASLTSAFTRDPPPHDLNQVKSKGKSPLPTTNTTVAAALTFKHSAVAASLLEELASSTPNPDVLWSSFNAVDLAGQSHLMNAHQYLNLIRGMYERPPLVLTVMTSTSRAKRYAIRIEFLKMRMAQAGAKDDGTLDKAMLKQFAALKYAPGVCQVWDRTLESKVPSVRMCSTVFQALNDWIGLHSKAGGKELAALAASPLVTRALSMMSDVAGEEKKTEAILEHFFQIAATARNMEVFTRGMKEVYGFDMEYPGVVLENTKGRKYREIGEKEIGWILSILAERDELSSMIAIFEVFDNPATPAAPSSYFDQSFHNSSTDPPSASAASSALPLPSASPHPIGTQAYSLLITTAGRLNQHHVVRHYFRQLSLRWEALAMHKIVLMEEAVGIFAAEEVIEGPMSVLEVTAAESSVTTTSSLPSSADALPLDTPISTPLPILRPLRDYYIPSALIHAIFRHGRTFYDAPTTAYIRSRTLLILHLMNNQVERIEAVRARLTPVEKEAEDGEGQEEGIGLKAISPNERTPSMRALDALSHEIAHLSFHRLQLRLLLPPIKSTSSIVDAYAHLHRLLTALRARERKLGLPSTFDSAASPSATAEYLKAAATTTNAGKKTLSKSLVIRRKSSQVLVAKKGVLRIRMGGLVKKGKTRGAWQWEECKRKLGQLELEEQRLREMFWSRKAAVVVAVEKDIAFEEPSYIGT